MLKHVKSDPHTKIFKMENKPLPFSNESEIAVLSSILTADSDECHEVFGLVKSEFFVNRVHRIIFEVALSQFNEGKPFDYVSMVDILTVKNKIQDVGGSYYLGRLTANHYPRHDIINSVKSLKEKFQLRSLIELSAEISDGAYSGNEPKELINQAEDRIFDLGTKMEIQTENLVVSASTEIDQMIAVRKSGEKIFGLQSGIHSFDSIHGGFQKGQYYILAGRPSSGKTAFADQVTMNVVTKNKPVLYICLEAGATRVLSKMACKLAGISYTRFSRSFCTDAELDAISTANRILRASPLILKRPFRITGADIRSLIKREFRKNDIQLVVLDYLQNIDQEREEERIAISKASRAIQDASVETGVPSLILAQLNREGDKNSRPRMAEIKGSGQIEQDADNIGLLWPEEDPFEVELSKPLPVILSIEKNKDGARSIDQKLYFDRELMTFKERTPETRNYVI